MLTKQKMIDPQAEAHPLVQIEAFADLEAYVLYLMHRKAYEEAAQLAHGKVTLDLGCNNGYGTSILSARASQTVGVDVSSQAIAVACQTYDKSTLKFLEFDGMKLPFPDQSFELIVSFQVIEHVTDVQAYLREIKRVLVANGTVMFTTPNACVRLDPGMKPWNGFHVREFTATELRELLRTVFTEVKLLGLFGTSELSAVELNRVGKARERARKQARALLPPWWKIRDKMIRTAKEILPEAVITNMRRALHGNAGNSALAQHPPDLRSDLISEAEWSKQFSTADLYYQETDLDSSLDLMAICRLC